MTFCPGESVSVSESVALRPWRKALACLTCCTALASAAQTTSAPAATQPSPHLSVCPASTFAPDLPADKEALRTEINALAPLAAACDMRADFHARHGALLLAAGWPQDAATALEKALLLNPELAGTQLDYAQALAQLGQRQPARDLVKQVVRRPDIQPDLREWLQDGLANAAAAHLHTPQDAAAQDTAASSWTWGTLLQTSLGHEDNLASATHTASLTLYLSTGPVDVILADSERPKAGTALKVLAAAQGVRPLAEGELRVNLAVQGRHAATQGVADNQLAEASMTYALPLGPGQVMGTVGLHSFVQTNVYNYKDQAYSLKYEPTWRWADCKGSAALGRIAQSYISSPSLDGNFDHLRLETACRPNNTGQLVAPAETIFGITAGRDNPLNANRPGGVKNRVAIDVRHETPMGQPFGKGQGTLTTWARYSQSHDAQVYSTLLGTDPTQTRRQDIGVGYWWPLQAGWSVGMDVESTLQKSTNALLDIKNFSVYGGLRWTGN